MNRKYRDGQLVRIVRIKASFSFPRKGFRVGTLGKVTGHVGFSVVPYVVRACRGRYAGVEERFAVSELEAVD